MEAANLRQTDWHIGSMFALVVGFGLTTGAWRSLSPLFAAWSQPEYSHAWFILPLAALIFLQRFRNVRIGGSRMPGLLAATISVVIMLFAWATGSYTAA